MSGNKPYGLAVKAVILDAQKRCLLLRRSRACRHFAGQWEWPGGKVDRGEDFAAALMREVHEETALAVKVTGFAGATHFEMPAAHVVLLCLETRVLSGKVKLSEEHDDLAWAPLDDLARWDLTDHVKPFMLDYAKRIGAARQI
jgi:8-oxo-dGTP diphosphatase